MNKLKCKKLKDAQQDNSMNSKKIQASKIIESSCCAVPLDVDRATLINEVKRLEAVEQLFISVMEHSHGAFTEKANGENEVCITCKRTLKKGFHAGHFLSAGNHSYTMFMEKNINGQCAYCNTYNGGREKEYKEALIEKYSSITVRALEKLRNKKVKRTADDYYKIEQFYRNKLKMLQ